MLKTVRVLSPRDMQIQGVESPLKRSDGQNRADSVLIPNWTVPDTMVMMFNRESFIFVTKNLSSFRGSWSDLLVA